MDICISYQ